MYSDAGSKTCLGLPGSRGNEDLDAQHFADLGVDFLKYDNCFAGPEDWIVDRYTAMRDALNKTGRPVLFSMCNWGAGDPWKWAQQVHAVTSLVYANCLLLVDTHFLLPSGAVFAAVAAVAVIAVTRLQTDRTTSRHHEQVRHPACALHLMAQNAAYAAVKSMKGLMIATTCFGLHVTVPSNCICCIRNLFYSLGSLGYRDQPRSASLGNVHLAGT